MHKTGFVTYVPPYNLTTTSRQSQNRPSITNLPILNKFNLYYLRLIFNFFNIVEGIDQITKLMLKERIFGSKNKSVIYNFEMQVFKKVTCGIIHM